MTITTPPGTTHLPSPTTLRAQPAPPGQHPDARALPTVPAPSGPVRPHRDQPPSDRPASDQPRSDQPQPDQPRPGQPRPGRPCPDPPGGDRPSRDRRGSDRPAHDLPVPDRPGQATSERATLDHPPRPGNADGSRAGAPWGHGTGPFSTLSVAADTAVREMARQSPLDLWLVAHVDGDRHRLLATAGPWAERAGPGDLAWPAALCTRLVADGGPSTVTDLGEDPVYRQRTVGRPLVPASWVGVPLVSAHGALFGALCGMSAAARPPGLDGALEPAQVMGRMLSTIIAGEQLVAGWAANAAAARARAERDHLTGLLDRRGWSSALVRSDAGPEPVSLLVLDVDDLRATNEESGHEAGDAELVAVARVLAQTCWRGDLLARVDGDEFAVLATGCDAVSVRVLASRVKVRLRAVGAPVSVGWATRRPREVLTSTWERAEQAMVLDKHRHRSR